MGSFSENPNLKLCTNANPPAPTGNQPNWFQLKAIILLVNVELNREAESTFTIFIYVITISSLHRWNSAFGDHTKQIKTNSLNVQVHELEAPCSYPFFSTDAPSWWPRQSFSYERSFHIIKIRLKYIQEVHCIEKKRAQHQMLHIFPNGTYWRRSKSGLRKQFSKMDLRTVHFGGVTCFSEITATILYPFDLSSSPTPLTNLEFWELFWCLFKEPKMNCFLWEDSNPSLLFPKNQCKHPWLASIRSFL